MSCAVHGSNMVQKKRVSLVTKPDCFELIFAAGKC